MTYEERKDHMLNENHEMNSYTNTNNDTNYYQTTQSTFQQSQMNRNMSPTQKQKKPKKNGFGKKLLVGLCCGLVFGIFAGVGFELVNVAKTGVSQAKAVFFSMAGITPAEEADSDDMNGVAENNDANTGEDTPEPETFVDSDAEPIRQTKEALSEASQSEMVVTDVTEVVKAVMPSVVSVNSKYIETTSFLGQQYSGEAESAGSGIIVGQNENELLLVTNYHVVESTEELSVQFVDGEQVAAQVKGTDEDKDLAVIAVLLDDIEEETLNRISIATLGDSDNLVVGEPVIAIGNALGYGQSVTTGVVSALNRAVAVSSTVFEEQNQYADKEINTFIQTDAAINPGNSGGALLNTRGQVIGINSSKIGGNAVEGMGYAIPISDAKPIIADLMNKETRLKVSESEKGFIGITGVDVVEEYSQVYGMPRGIYVSSVIEDSGADQAGLVRGDIIVAINDLEVTSMTELKNELAYYKAGDTVRLTIMQGSPTGFQSKDVDVTLGKQND